jgi:hypothetical protein
MGVDDSLSAIQLLIEWIERFVTEPLIFVVGPHAHTIGLQRIHRVGSFTKTPFNIRQRQGRKYAEAARIVRPQFRRILIAVAGDLSDALNTAEPDARTGNRSQRGCSSPLIHVFERL